MQSINSSLSNSFKLVDSNNWKINVIKKEISIFNLKNKYTQYTICKFTLITKRTRLTLKQFTKMITKEKMTFKKKIFIEILYNQEAILVWDFSEIRKVKKKVVLP